jgi:hypothetical protein
MMKATLVPHRRGQCKEGEYPTTMTEVEGEHKVYDISLIATGYP